MHLGEIVECRARVSSKDNARCVQVQPVQADAPCALSGAGAHYGVIGGGGQLGNSTLKRDNLGMALEFIALSTDCQCQLVLCGFVQYIQDISFGQLTDLIT